MSPAIRSISVLLPIFEGARFLERVLTALSQQVVDVPWDFLAVDCGSRDGTLDIFREFSARFPVPLRVHGLGEGEFGHGDTRNLLAGLSSGDLLVFIVDDVIPVSDRWLATLASNFEDPRVGGAYCRNIPRPEARPVARVQSADDPGYAEGGHSVRIPSLAEYHRMDPHARRELYNFNDVCSAIRREAWEKHPYPRLRFGEDVLMGRALLEAGWHVVYEDRATVFHTHDYEAAEVLPRARADGAFSAEWLDRECVTSISEGRWLAERAAAADRERLRDEGLDGPELAAATARALELRQAHFRGLYEGGRTTVRRRFGRPLERSKLRVLGLGSQLRPGDAEVAMLSELAARGHECALWLTAGDSTGPWPEALDVRVVAGGLDGALAGAFGGLGPDVVHFFGLPSEAAVEAAAGLPRVLQLDSTEIHDGAETLDALVRRMDRVLCPCRADRDELTRRTGLGWTPAIVSAAPRLDAPLDLERIDEPAEPGVRAKSVHEAAVELEHRYRELACRHGVGSGAGRALDLSRARGELNSDKVGAIDLDLTDADAGIREVAITLVPEVGVGPGESTAPLRVEVDGKTVLEVDALIAGAAAEPRTLSARVDVGETPRLLRIEAVRGPGHASRVAELTAVTLSDPFDEADRARPELLVDRLPCDVVAVDGDASREPGMLRLGQGSAAEFALGCVGTGRCEISLHFLRGEQGTGAHGRLIVDGLTLARFGLQGSEEAEPLRVMRLVYHFDRPPQKLRLEIETEGEALADFVRLTVRALPGGESGLLRILRRRASKLRRMVGVPVRMRG